MEKKVVAETQVVEETTATEETNVTEPKLLMVKVVSSFYDLKNDDKLRNIGDTFEVEKDRAEYLIGRKLVEYVKD